MYLTVNDNSLDKGKVFWNLKPSFLAIHAVVTSIGPVIGLFVGGFLLNFYTDFDRVDVSKWVF
jgi:hypothetical protein